MSLAIIAIKGKGDFQRDDFVYKSKVRKESNRKCEQESCQWVRKKFQIMWKYPSDSSGSALLSPMILRSFRKCYLFIRQQFHIMHIYKVSQRLG